ncbi:Helicase conserved C-terminal domain [Nakaseomyces glabratus]|nr:Helicase conserved C-terminal domain [Nakaseomyces glabratus]KAH7579958.1 Helicase conserved C-terminal domain [Nakaseomyces glabratus]
MLRILKQSFRNNAPSLKWYSTTATPILRDYQNDAIKSCLDAIALGKKRIGVSLATGGGKTVIFSSLINLLRQRNRGNACRFRTLILVHRRELAEQAVRTTSRINEDLNIQLEMGNQNCEVSKSDVIVASVQSIIRRLHKYREGDIDLIIIDEAHHAAADSYKKVLKHFRCDTANTRIPVIGFSATFERYDKKSLKESFDELVYHRGIIEMIDDNWLCESKFTTVRLEVDLSKIPISTLTSDFQTGALSRLLNTQTVNSIIYNSYLEKRKENNIKSSLLFGVDINHIECLERYFNERGIKAKAVSSKTSVEDRQKAIRDIKSGELEVLLNCGIFTEGTDIPNIDCILLCRPTKSRTLLVQMIGRGLRLHHSKEYCHIIDFVGSTKAGVVSVPSLLGIESCEDTFDNATLEELRKIKIEEETRMAEYQQMQTQAELQKRAHEEMLRNQLDKMEQTLLEVSHGDALDLNLISYANFKEYHEKLQAGIAVDLNKINQIEEELSFIHKSKYAWVRITKNCWAFDLSNGHHIRLYRSSDKPGGTRYTLKLYREIPKLYRDEVNSSIRYVPTILEKDQDLSQITLKLEQVIKKYEDLGNSNSLGRIIKYARWRSQEASPKQKILVEKIIQKQLTKLKNSNDSMNIDPYSISSYIKNLTKGSASKLLFATRIAPTFPVQGLLKNLKNTSK